MDERLWNGRLRDFKGLCTPPHPHGGGQRGKSLFLYRTGGDWERRYDTDKPVSLSVFEKARRFGPDIIVWRLLENCSCDNFNGPLYEEKCKELIDYVNLKESRNVIITTSFWKHPGSRFSRRVAAEKGYALVELEQYGEMDEMKALGKFTHEGVANHPGDRGMQAIAEAIWQPMQKNK